MTPNYGGDVMDKEVIGLNSLPLRGIIKCPYCSKGRSYVYSDVGLVSSKCENCARLVLWNMTEMVSYKAKARKFNT